MTREHGADSVIHSGVAIRENSVLGERVIVHNNAVIGCEVSDTLKTKNVTGSRSADRSSRIEDDVEIGAGTTIDRASVGESRIGRGTKVDNLVQIGHHARLAKTRCFARRLVWPAVHTSVIV